MSDSLKQRFDEFRSQYTLLPEAAEPPPTTLQILGRNTAERDWQRLLFHFLSPAEAHGLDHALLDHFLSALSDRDDVTYSFSRFDLNDIRIETEVITSNGRRPDAVIWADEDWFICWELKVEAAEDDDQTADYVDAESFSSIGLETDDVPPDDRQYVYLAPDDAPPPDAGEFVPITWEWVASTLQSFLAASLGEYPARTTAQLSDFADTIRSELVMTEYEETQQDKVELFFEYYDEITDVHAAFTERWDEFTDTWGSELAAALDGVTVVENGDVPAEYVLADIRMDGSERRQWVFRQGHADWSMVFPREWWTKLDEAVQITDSPKPNARVGFVHRLGDQYRSVAIGDRKLKFWLRNARAGHDEFVEHFADRFRNDDEIPELLPARTSRTEAKVDVLEATYEIDVAAHDDFFEAYVAALANAIDEHVVSNPALVRRIDALYHDTIAQDLSFTVPDSLSETVSSHRAGNPP